MARREVRDRQYTIYLPSHEDLDRWRTLSKPYTLNHWIVEMVEKGIEEVPKSKMKSSDEINALRKENLKLKKEMAILEQKRVREVEEILERAKEPMPLDKKVVDLIRAGGYWPSARIIKELKITAEKEIVEEPLHDELREESILTRRVYSSERATVSNSGRAKVISSTLEQLENLGLVENTWKGWIWRK